jgi:hypothetical protein
MSLDLDPIKAREAAATPRAVGGVWCHRCMSLAALSLGSPERVGTVNFSGFAEVQHAANRTFIAHARTDVPALLAEVRRLRAQSLSPRSTACAATLTAGTGWRERHRCVPV